MGSAEVQGELWGRDPETWANFQEAQMRPIYDATLDALEPLAGRALLDAGCGAGLAVRLAADRGAAVSGLDASAPLLEVARGRTPEAGLRTGDIQALPFEDASFNVVTSFNAIQYAADPAAAVAQLARVCRPGGPVAMPFLCVLSSLRRRATAGNAIVTDGEETSASYSSSTSTLPVTSKQIACCHVAIECGDIQALRMSVRGSMAFTVGFCVSFAFHGRPPLADGCSVFRSTAGSRTQPRALSAPVGHRTIQSRIVPGPGCRPRQATLSRWCVLWLARPASARSTEPRSRPYKSRSPDRGHAPVPAER